MILQVKQLDEERCSVHFNHIDLFTESYLGFSILESIIGMGSFDLDE